jgi:single-stranded DNA-binding protein
MNRVFIVGKITGNIFFDVLGNRPVLKFLFMAGKPRPIRCLWIVLWDENAIKFFPYLQKGSEVGVIGHLTMRVVKRKWITEVEASHLILLKNIKWENGDAPREDLLPDMSLSFLVGALEEDPYFEWRNGPGEGQASLADSRRCAYMHLSLGNSEHLQGLGVSVYGALAQVAASYLRAGSVIAVDGKLRTKDKGNGHKIFDLTAEHIAFLDNQDEQHGR